MRANIRRIIDACKRGQVAQEATCSTDGSTIYSYDMPIACIRKDAKQIVRYDAAPSATTRSQIRACELTWPDAIRVGSLDGVDHSTDVGANIHPEHVRRIRY